MIANGLHVHIYNPQSETFLSMDVSGIGLGAVLTQLQNGKEVTICYAVHILTPRKCNNSTGDREALAAVWGCE